MDYLLPAVILGFVITLAGCDHEVDPSRSFQHFLANSEHLSYLKEHSGSACVESKSCLSSGIGNLGFDDNENVLAEGWVNANILNYSRDRELKTLQKESTHVSLDLKYLLSSNAEQPDSSGRVSALNFWLTLLIVVVAAAILS